MVCGVITGLVVVTIIASTNTVFVTGIAIVSELDLPGWLGWIGRADTHLAWLGFPCYTDRVQPLPGISMMMHHFHRR